ncbi:MAG: hypothetical protein ABI488_12235 [Polyangiaceae bacterium]
MMNRTLLIGVSSMTVLAALVTLQACDDGSTSAGAAGAATAGTVGDGTSGMAATAAGSSGMASTIAGGGSTAAGTGGTATTAGAGGASAGAGGSSAGAGGSQAGAGGSQAGAGGSSAGAGGSSAGAGGSGGSSGSGGSGGVPGASPACTTFCTDEMTTCMFTGDTAAYTSAEDCLAACATFTPGSGTTGNTLACRQYHVTNAKTAGAAMHCPHTAKFSHNMGSAATATDGPCN